jgi:hypothetical protein
LKLKKERLANFVNQLVQDEDLAKKFNEKIKKAHDANIAKSSMP